MIEYLRKLLHISVLLMFCSTLWAQTNISDLNKNSVDKYLEGYIANNLDLQELKLQVEDAKAELEMVTIENGIGVEATTGSSTITLDDSDIELDIDPSVTVSIPKSQNTEVTASVPMTITSDSETGTYFSGAGISISRDIISETSNEYTLNIEYYERLLYEAELAVETKLISLKSEFWEAVYDIYSADKSVKEYSEDLYDNQIDFEQIIAQGYSENSSTYRVAELEVQESLFTVEKAQRDLDTLLGAFAVDCGFNPWEIEELPTIPEDYYSLTLIDFEGLDKNNYIDLEDAIQENEYQSKVRAADSDFSLSAGAGYDYTGYTDSNSNSTDDDEGNRLFTELSAEYGGLTTSLGISTLLEEPTEPSLTFSFSYDFGTSKTDEIDDRQDEIDSQIELLEIKGAEESWIEDNLDYSSTKATLEWTREQNAKQLILYKQMYEDSIIWFDQGIIAETDLLQAKNSYETKIDTSILTIIDTIIYNFGIEKLFIGDK